MIASLGKIILIGFFLATLGGMAFLSFKDVTIPTKTITKTINYEAAK